MSKGVDIVGLGFCGLDYLSLVPKIPYDEKVEIIESLIQGGGPAATAVVAARRLGARAGFIGAVGNDERGKNIIKEFKEEGVDIGYILIQDSAVSPAASCWIEQSTGKRSIAWTKGNIQPLSPDSVDSDYIASAKILHLDGHHTKAAIRAAETARKTNTKVSLDAGTIMPNIDRLISLTDILIASEFFAREFIGQEDVALAAERLFSMGPEIVVITQGEKGSYALTEKGVLRKDSYKVNVVDTTGAGDAFHGAFIYAYLQRWNLEKIVDFARAAAAFNCRKLGGRTGIPGLNEVEKFLNI